METRIVEKISLPKRRRDQFVDLRARFPFLLRYVAVSALILTVIVIAIGYWYSRGNVKFVMRGETPELSQNVTSVVNGYERRVTMGDKTQMFVRADRETTFDDGRHELDNIYLENYAENAEKPDRITAIKAVYLPDAAKPDSFNVNFTGNVNFETRDGLKAITEQITYDRVKDYAETASLINFSRENISGSAIGAKFNIKNKNVELLNQVNIDVASNGNAAKNSLTDFGASTVKIAANQASFNQDLARLELNGGVNINTIPVDPNKIPTTVRAEKAVYEKDEQKLDLTGSVEIVTASENAAALGGGNPNSNAPSVPVTIRGNTAVYEQGIGKIHINGNASVEQARELMNGDAIDAEINEQKKLQKVFTRGNAFLRTVSSERTTEVRAAEMFFGFDQNQQINHANATGNAKVHSTSVDNTLDLTDASSLILNFKPVQNHSLLEKIVASGNANVALTANNSADYSNINMLAANSTEVLFAAANDQSILNQMTTGGRTTVTMSAPASQTNNARATSKKMIADALKLLWNQTGKDLSRSEAVGNAELYIVPQGSAPDIDRQSLFAPRFDCDFYPTGNLAKTFVASTKAKAVIEPTEPSQERGTKTLFGDKLTANFQMTTGVVESFDASGNAKFNELDRNGTANNFVYTTSDETIRLRGGEPTVWDARARLKAAEIDSDLRRDTSFGRGKVATTYYSQEATGGATPFTKQNAPVFVVSDKSEFNHTTGVAVYTGNARAWQDSNFVRAERLVLRRDSKSMFGEGAVQSALYNARTQKNNQESVVPVFGASDRINYLSQNNLLRYESNVDIRQGTDRITGGVADVFMNQANEVEKTVAQNNVVVTQPGKKATGDWAQYTAADEVVVMRGNPATVEDAQQGSSNGRQLTMYLRENRVVGQGGATPTAPGRIRSTHKVTKQ